LTILTTPRLILRPWRAEDLAPFAAMNADPAVRRYFPGLLTRGESDASVGRFQAHIEAEGFGFWAIERIDGAEFIGFTGLMRVTFPAPFTPTVEIGWRLARAHWGLGYAIEAATIAMHAGFAHFGLPEVVAFAVEANLPSRRVMERVGMHHDPRDDFDHPSVPPGPLRRHVLYRSASLGRS
jgi:ribosomal-protein-alanine N-acetyltransferase